MNTQEAELQYYTIVYKDGNERSLLATDYEKRHDWYFFYLDGKMILRIPAVYVDKVLA